MMGIRTAMAHTNLRDRHREIMNLARELEGKQKLIDTLVADKTQLTERYAKAVSDKERMQATLVVAQRDVELAHSYRSLFVNSCFRGFLRQCHFGRRLHERTTVLSHMLKELIAATEDPMLELEQFLGTSNLEALEGTSQNDLSMLRNKEDMKLWREEMQIYIKRRNSKPPNFHAMHQLDEMQQVSGYVHSLATQMAGAINKWRTSSSQFFQDALEAGAENKTLRQKKIRLSLQGCRR